MKLTAQARVTAGDGLLRLWLTDQNGTTESYVMPPHIGRAIAQALRDGARAVAPQDTGWQASRYRIAPGSPGGWEIGAPQHGLLPILFHVMPGIQLELCLPPEDTARLVDQIAKARSIPPMPETPNA